MKLAKSDKDRLVQETSWLPDKEKLSLRIDVILEGRTCPPNCETCGKPVSYSNGEWKRFCSRSCIRYDDNETQEISLKRKKTNIEKYGTEFVTQNEEVQEKTRQTNLEKFGTDNPFKSPEIKEKIKQTNIEKYGVDHHTKVSRIPDEQMFPAIDLFLNKGYSLEEAAKACSVSSMTIRKFLIKSGIDTARGCKL